MAYATANDVQARMLRTLTESERAMVSVLLDDAAALIDLAGSSVSDDVKLIVSCRMVIRAIGDGSDGIPVGASQGSMSGLGYSQSWTIGGSGAVGELYLSKADRKMLGLGNSIGSYSPVEELVVTQHD